MFLTGACGLILFAMIFSQHPTVSLNLQILLLNPLNLVFLWSASKKIKNGQPCKWQKAWTVLIILFLLGGKCSLMQRESTLWHCLCYTET